MRIALVAAALLAASPAAAAYIEGDLPMACRELAAQRRIDTVAGAGDSAGTTALVQRYLDSGQCWPMSVGTRVRVEDNAFPYACVAVFGSASPCAWIRQRNVNVRN